jgi:serine/threonine-protein kinase HipA
MTRAKRPHRETRLDGLFGVFRDARPEGFGLGLLEQALAVDSIGPMVRLEQCEGDSVGAVAVCDNVERKSNFVAPVLDDLLDCLGRLPADQPSSHVVPVLKGTGGTGLGGERPKVTVLHKGQLWIAKLQDEGDAPHTPLREFIAMHLAPECGVDTSEVEFHAVGWREVVLVKRFDRVVLPSGGITRHLYASAHTVLRLAAETRGDRQRSYAALAAMMDRWCGARDLDPTVYRQELWRRVAYNSLCGNFDDHPRNHGLVHRDGRWVLSPAFDISPYIRPSGVFSMAVTQEGKSLATAQALLSAAPIFDWDPEDARAHLLHCREVLLRRWPEAVLALGFDATAAPYLDPAWLGSIETADLLPRRRVRSHNQ